MQTAHVGVIENRDPKLFVVQLFSKYSNLCDKMLSYRRETARQLHTSFSARSLIVHFTVVHLLYNYIID